MFLKSGSPQTGIGIYDFAKDPGGGAVGIVTTGVYIPKNALVKNFFACALDSVTGAAGCEIAFGWQQVGGSSASDAAYLTSTAVAGFVLNTPFGNKAFQTTGSVKNDFVSEVIMKINVAALTRGKIQFFIEYYESDI